MADRRVIEHVTLEAHGARDFYRRVLATLGLAETIDEHGRSAYGPIGEFGVYDAADAFYQRSHVAFTANSADEVDRFYRVALLAGGRSLDPPRQRPEFAPGFYSAYVEDPAGNVLEVLYRDPAISET